MILCIFLVVLYFFSPLVHAATGVSVASQGPPGTGLCSITRQFSQTDMAAWHTTALTLVPSPSTGLTIFPITITASYNYTTSRYIFTDNLDPTTELRVGNITFKTFDAFPNLFHSSPSYPHVLQLLVATTNNGNLEPFVGAASSLKTTALSLVNVSGTARISGDGDVIISTQYYLLNSDGTISGQCTPSTAAPSDGITISVGGNSSGPTVPSRIVNVAALAVDPATGAPCGTGSNSSLWDCWLDNINNTGGFQANTVYYFPSGHYFLRTGLVVSSNGISCSGGATTGCGVMLKGDGRGATVLHYVATSDVITGNYAAVRFYSGCTATAEAPICPALSHVTIRDMTIRNNSFTGQKHVGLDLVDTFFMTVENVEISNFASCYRCFTANEVPGHTCLAHRQVDGSTCSFTPGIDGESTGILLRGREEILINNVDIQADVPIEMQENPAYRESTSPVVLGGNDHLTVSNVWLTSNSTALPIVYINTNMPMSNFSGYQAWSGGCGGVRWIAPNQYYYNAGNVFGTIRHEQLIAQGATDAQGSLGCTEPWEFDVQVGAVNGGYQYQFTVDTFYANAGANGFRFRHVKGLTLKNVFHHITQNGMTEFDVDGTVFNLSILNSTWAADGGITIGAHFTDQTCYLASSTPTVTHVPATLACYGPEGG